MQRIARNKEPIYYQFDFWEKAPITHGVFTRMGGVSQGYWESLNVGGTVGDDVEAVAENGRRIYASLNLREKNICTVWQVHGTDVVVANEVMPKRKWLSRADAMISDKIGTVLVMRFADCVPLLFYDPENHVIGMAHAGWRGTVDGVGPSTLKAMQEVYGTEAGKVQVAIGPSIGPDAYQVGEEVVEAIKKGFGTTEALVKRGTDGSAYFNLWEANRRALADCGVQQIEIAGICTATHTEEFFSHRAEKGKTGRFGVVLALKDKLM